MKTADFYYQLPPELIAQQPLPQRAAARLMVVRRDQGTLEHRQVGDLTELLGATDLLVVNDTRVIPARLFGFKAKSAGAVEVLLLEELSACAAAGQPPVSDWSALVKAARRPAPGAELLLADGAIRAQVRQQLDQGKLLLRLMSNGGTVLEILERQGVTPLPPYIKRPRRPSAQTAIDRQRYQTIYAERPGAIAAPTAGLHFSAALLERLEHQGVERAAVTLHVGLGTFRPVNCAKVQEHQMESERYIVSAAAAARIAAAQARRARIVAVGSTVVRVLETLAGERGAIAPSQGRSSLFIYPPYNFRVVGALLTNFHLPQSTLLMMVCAFAGSDLIRQAYAAAIRERYRFYSYGDCMLIL